MPPAPFPVTLQISIAPGDHRLAAGLLAHQTAFWRPAVSEILITVDARRHGTYQGGDWKIARRRVFEVASAIPNARVAEVDYSREARHGVSDEFFGGAPVPAKDWQGGPYYAYFFGLHAARNDFVLHIDADMFFGGECLPWLKTALALHGTRPELLFLGPLPGPPSPDGRLKQLPALREMIDGIDGYLFSEITTRLFLFSRSRFRERVTSLQTHAPALRARFLAFLDGNPAQELPEHLLSEVMQKRQLKCFNFAGPAPGCWSLHPPYRSQDFFNKIPALLARIEKSDLPAAQLGDHDINESLVDWSEAITRMASRRWWHRLRDRFLNDTA